jgi:hypothetical protein
VGSGAWHFTFGTASGVYTPLLKNTASHVNSLNPKYTPTIPVTPANAGGAGIGNLNKANRNPTITPVISANIVSLIEISSYVKRKRHHYTNHFIYIQLKDPLLSLEGLY